MEIFSDRGLSSFSPSCLTVQSSYRLPLQSARWVGGPWLPSPSRGASYSISKRKDAFFPLGGSYWQSVLLGSQCWVVKLKAKGEPQYQTHSKAKSWRFLSKMSPVEQLHQGAVKLSSQSLFFYFWGRISIYSLIKSLNTSDWGSALFRLLTVSLYNARSFPCLLNLFNFHFRLFFAFMKYSR